jgi:hypothetical protein
LRHRVGNSLRSSAGMLVRWLAAIASPSLVHASQREPDQRSVAVSIFRIEEPGLTRVQASSDRPLTEHACKHLRRLREYLAYYRGDRTHLGVEKDAPVARSVELRPAGASSVRARRWVGGLYHRYEWAAAA